MADEAIRNTVEGKFGQGKRRFGLGRVMAKLASTSAAQISLTFLVMNLELALRRFLFSLISVWHCFAALRHPRVSRPFTPIHQPPTWPSPPSAPRTRPAKFYAFVAE